MTNVPHESDTRSRLIEAAGNIFAERGFREATVRDICAVAGANIAAVSYYFGDKLGLYTAALQSIHATEPGQVPVVPTIDSAAPAADQLRGYVRHFVMMLFDPQRPAWHGVLLSRELVEPTPALSMLVQDVIRPRYEMICAIVRRLLGPAADAERVRLSAYSVVGQCLHYKHGRHVMALLEPEVAFDPPFVQRVVEHISQFTLAALEALRREVEAPKRGEGV